MHAWGGAITHITPTNHPNQVLVVLSGCPSDADCVALASRFALHSLVNITLMLMPAAQVRSEQLTNMNIYTHTCIQRTRQQEPYHKPPTPHTHVCIQCIHSLQRPHHLPTSNPQQEQSGKYADFLKDFGPGERFTNVRLLRLEPYDADLQPRSHDSLMKVRVVSCCAGMSFLYSFVLVAVPGC